MEWINLRINLTCKCSVFPLEVHKGLCLRRDEKDDSSAQFTSSISGSSINFIIMVSQTVIAIDPRAAIQRNWFNSLLVAKQARKSPIFKKMHRKPYQF